MPATDHKSTQPEQWIKMKTTKKQNQNNDNMIFDVCSKEFALINTHN